jgi:Flp pilus assembly protein TadD
VDSLLAVPAPEPALAAARDLWRVWAEHPVYGWQIEGRLGLALLVAGQPAAAVPHLENTVRRHPREAAHHRNLGAALLQLNRRGRALSEYQAAVELEPGRADLRREYGQLLLSFGDTKRAAREILTARQLCGNCPEMDEPLASLYLMEEDFPQAVPPLRRIYERKPDPAHRQALVAAVAQAGDDSVLVATLEGLPGADFTTAEWRLLIEAEGRLGRWDHSLQAASLLTGGPEAVPAAIAGEAPFWGQAALNLLAARMYAAGLAAADRAIALAPAEVVYRNNRVVLLTRLGRDTEARQEWKRVLALDPSLAQDEP